MARFKYYIIPAGGVAVLGTDHETQANIYALDDDNVVLNAETGFTLFEGEEYDSVKEAPILADEEEEEDEE